MEKNMTEFLECFSFLTIRGYSRSFAFKHLTQYL